MTKPLKGIKIVEFTHVIAGPFCGMLLGDLGADSIKIERPGEGEYGRINGAKNDDGISIWYPTYNRNKKNLSLNMKSKEAYEIIRKLVQQSDVLIENFRPRLLAEMGFGYEEVKKINPKIIMLSISGFGQKGPYAAKPAFDMTVSAFSGFMAVNGPPGVPTKAGPPISDFIAGLYGAFAVMVALRHRDMTGEGQYIDVAMMDGIMSVMEYYFATYKLLGREPQGSGNRRPDTAPANIFQAKDERFVYVTSLTAGSWAGLCKVMGKEEMIKDPRFIDANTRKRNEAEVEQAISAWMGSLTADDAVALLEKNGVPCAPVKKVSDVIDDAHVRERNSIVEFDYPGIGKFPVAAFVPRFSTITTNLERPALLGENNKEVVCDYLGYSERDFSSMCAAGVFDEYRK